MLSGLSLTLKDNVRVWAFSSADFVWIAERDGLDLQGPPQRLVLLLREECVKHLEDMNESIVAFTKLGA